MINPLGARPGPPDQDAGTKWPDCPRPLLPPRQWTCRRPLPGAVPPGRAIVKSRPATSPTAATSSTTAPIRIAIAGPSWSRGITGLDHGRCGGGGVVEPDPSVRDIADAVAPSAITVPRPVTIRGFSMGCTSRSRRLRTSPSAPGGRTPRPGRPEARHDVAQPPLDPRRRRPSDRRWVVRTLEGSKYDSDRLVYMARQLLL